MGRRGGGRGGGEEGRKGGREERMGGGNEMRNLGSEGVRLVVVICTRMTCHYVFAS